jgi:hypothetical protein
MVKAGVLTVVLALSAPVAAQDGGGGRIALDLNRLDDTDGACRLTFVADNRLTSLSALVLEAVLFDPAGRVASLTLFDFGDLPADRRRVRQFDVADLACAQVAQVLVNGVATCAGDGVDPSACGSALAVSGSVPGVEVVP